MSLIAYFDESGTHYGGPNAAKVFVIAGYIAPESVWRDDFVPQWRALLDRFELPDNPVPRYFHATELEGAGYPYNRLSENQRNELKMAAVKIVTNCGIIGVGGGVVNEVYQRLMAPYVATGVAYKDPYVFMFTDVILEAIDRSEMFLGEDHDEEIAFVFEDHPRWAIQAHDMFIRLKHDAEWPRRVRLGTDAFEDKKKFFPIQAADHIAFETFHYMERSGLPLRPAMNRFLSWPQNHGRYYDEKGLRQFIEICKKDGKF